MGYLTNRPTPTRIDLSPGSGSSAEGDGLDTHGLSNTPLDAPFEKVTRGRSRMRRQLDDWTQSGENENELVDRMMDLLSYVPVPSKPHTCEDRRLTKGPDNQYPSTHLPMLLTPPCSNRSE